MSDPLWWPLQKLKLEAHETLPTVKEAWMSGQRCFEDFEHDALQHLNSVYNLARWLTRNDPDAEDIVQETYLRAFRFRQCFRGGDARPWLLKIVRNVYYTSSRKNSTRQFVDFDDDLDTSESCSPNSEEILIQASSGAVVRRALETLPTRYREMLVLREMEGMSYKEISTVMKVPMGTVMSTLSRARADLRHSVIKLTNERPEAIRET
jgi:RNA polymerase sigma factor (sigma-70 family)